MKRRGGRRLGGRSANTRRTAAALKQVPWGLPHNSDAPTEPLDEEAVHAIHDGAMRVLEEIGMVDQLSADSLSDHCRLHEERLELRFLGTQQLERVKTDNVAFKFADPKQVFA